MKYTFLPSTNIKVSKICLGTMTFGNQNSEKEGFDQMDLATDMGINFIDTAELYPVPATAELYADTEKIIGKWMSKKNNRDQIVLATKIAGPGDYTKHIRTTGFTKSALSSAVDESLKRLKTDYIDLYQLHWPERKVPRFGELDYKYDPNDNVWTTVEEVLYNLNELVKSGKIRYVGLSNETPWGMMKFLEVAKEKNFPRMMSIQNVYSLVNRVFDIGHSEVSMAENLGLLAYSPLAGGRLSGKYIGGINPKNARYTLWPRRFSRHHTERGEKAIDKYVSLANKYEIPPSTFANAFVNDRPFVTSNIIGATTMDQLKENIDSIDIQLTDEMHSDIEEVHLTNPNPCV